MDNFFLFSFVIGVKNPVDIILKLEIYIYISFICNLGGLPGHGLPGQGLHVHAGAGGYAGARTHHHLNAPTHHRVTSTATGTKII